MLTRRRFTRTVLGLITLASGRPSGANPAGGLEGPLTRDTFRALEGQEVSLLLPNRPATPLLLRVEDAARADGSQFTVVFQGSPELKLAEGTYRITHATAGTTDVYLRPKGRDDRYSYFEAPFNVPPDKAGVIDTAPGRQLRRFERPLYEPQR